MTRQITPVQQPAGSVVPSAIALPQNNMLVGNAGGVAAAVGPGQLPGTATNDNAAAGKVGEFLSAALPLGSAISLTTGVVSDIISLSLTAGDWDLAANAFFDGDPTTTITGISVAISLIDATLPSVGGMNRGNLFLNGAAPLATIDPSISVPRTRVTLTATTTIYFVARASFAISTLVAFGTLVARRVR